MVTSCVARSFDIFGVEMVLFGVERRVVEETAVLSSCGSLSDGVEKN